MINAPQAQTVNVMMYKSMMMWSPLRTVVKHKDKLSDAQPLSTQTGLDTDYGAGAAGGRRQR